MFSPNYFVASRLSDKQIKGNKIDRIRLLLEINPKFMKVSSAMSFMMYDCEKLNDADPLCYSKRDRLQVLRALLYGR